MFTTKERKPTNTCNRSQCLYQHSCFESSTLAEEKDRKMILYFMQQDHIIRATGATCSSLRHTMEAPWALPLRSSVSDYTCLFPAPWLRLSWRASPVPPRGPHDSSLLPSLVPPSWSTGELWLRCSLRTGIGSAPAGGHARQTILRRHWRASAGASVGAVCLTHQAHEYPAESGLAET